MERFDIVIAGAGLAGLSLAYHLIRAGMADRTLLLVDRAPKHANDRTWCFWEAGEGVYEPIVHHRWDRVAFHSHRFSTVLDIVPYRYKMIRGEDFYRFMERALGSQPNIAWRYGDVQGIEDTPAGATVRVDGQAFQGNRVFNSLQLQPPARDASRYHYLLQHFEGWVIETPDPRFDPGIATLMDFRIEQRGQTRFCYVLPEDDRRALVEFTVFSPELLPRPEYASELRSYLDGFLRVNEYAVLHQEFGVIPMTDAPFQTRPSPRVMNIGTAGGRTKPSTGYTFLRIQQQSRAIAESLLTTGDPFYKEPLFKRRFGLYDSVLLNILDRGRYHGRDVFADLFQRNRAATVLKFLDEQTTFAEDLSILSSVNLYPFIAGSADAVWRRLKRPAGGR